MKIKTEGKCSKCNGSYTTRTASTHLKKCVVPSFQPSAAMTEGYLIRVSWALDRSLYWMFIAMPKNKPLDLLDEFLRDTWLECCGHLSEFTINGQQYLSHPEAGDGTKSMGSSIGKVLSPGMKCDYIYDMGSSTELELQVIEEIPACPSKVVTLLMRNDPPVFPCESCDKTSKVICSYCGDTLCQACKKKHPCAVAEGDAYMLFPLANSPRAGICGYG